MQTWAIFNNLCVEIDMTMKSLIYTVLTMMCVAVAIPSYSQVEEDVKPLMTKEEAIKMAEEVNKKAKEKSKDAVIKDVNGSTITTDKPKAKKSKSVWKTLAKITYKKEFDELMGFKIDKPVFSDKVYALEGKEVEIKGYIIPVEGYKSHSEFIFSAFPYNMCFFCGGAGPETVMEVKSKEPVKYTAEQIVLKGKLQLNADDINRLMYIMTDAELIEK